MLPAVSLQPHFDACVDILDAWCRQACDPSERCNIPRVYSTRTGSWPGGLLIVCLVTHLATPAAAESL